MKVLSIVFIHLERLNRLRPTQSVVMVLQLDDVPSLYLQELVSLPSCTHLKLCGTDRMWSRPGKVALVRLYLYCQDMWGSWLTSGLVDLKFHVVTVSGDRRPLKSPGP